MSTPIFATSYIKTNLYLLFIIRLSFSLEQIQNNILCLFLQVRLHLRSPITSHSSRSWSLWVCAQSCQFFAAPWTITHQALLFLEFSKQEYWSELPFPPPVDIPDPRFEPVSLGSPALAGRFFTTEPPGKPRSWSFSSSNSIIGQKAITLLSEVLS